MNKNEKIAAFDPNSVGNKNEGLFGLPFSTEECEVIVIPVPWEVTVSYGSGTANGPEAVREASYQVDLYDPYVADAWKLGIGMDAIDQAIKRKSDALRDRTEVYINSLENGEASNPDFLNEIRTECLGVNAWVKQRALHFLERGKTVGILGGDHSTPLGMIQALAERNDSFGILQIDAHADLRDAYEGFEFSHASIMFNALKLPQVAKLVQVGIRDYCQDEVALIANSNDRITTFFDRDLKHAHYKGESWEQVCRRIIAALPQKVYLSFDIDGLDPKLCPNTGTPVAGGFEAEEVLFLLEQVQASGREFIGFDLNEVSPAEDNDWDANVGARLLYRIANLVAKSQGKV